MTRTLKAADLFCGAGGTSTGLVEACQDLGYKCQLTAINHWNVAVATHEKNHPDARHLCASLDALNPRDLYKEGELDVLWASPECTHHSIARGGKPINDQSRATAWCVIRWAEALRPKIILVENVKEFLSWGKCDAGGKKIKEKLGGIFMSWVGNLEALGYRVDWRIMCAADHGDPTTRKRLFVQAVRGKYKIVWPEPSHGQTESKDLFGNRQPWKTARNDVIDWSIQGNSIYTRKKPLAEKTMRRILIGLEKFGLAPFILPHPRPKGDGPRTVDEPLQTVTATSCDMSLANPYLIKMRGTNDAASVDKPSPAVTGSQNLALAEPYLISVNHGNGKDKNGDSRRVRSVNKPLGTVTGSRGLALCKPYLVGAGGPQGAAKPRSVDRPVGTVLAENHSALCQPFIIAMDHTGGNGNYTNSTDAPLSAVTTKQRHAVCQPVLRSNDKWENEPPPIFEKDGLKLAQPYLVQFYGNSDGGQSVNNPLGTVTTKDRFGLCQPVVEIDGELYKVDILFRMLKPKELALAQGFPSDYEFTGNISQVVKQIGNAVPKNLAKAIVKAVLTQSAI